MYYNEEWFDRLATLVRGTGVTPFVGAGLSMPSEMPGWRQFLEREAERAGISERVVQLLDAGLYEEAAQEVYDALERNLFDERLHSSYGPEIVPSARLGGAVVQIGCR